ncbi:hypothetical protein N0V93_006884 [Gnomoniopsis smithogilvyi]|uniref:HypA n=1 Tax=Gnomoniopsis smithogilvyi TaxID=1191159 RepID=A0A9W8YQJ3_9PEZI|nr:hypothetical protein N0V93_006884 [Gnomoniopsis smithogilvyi]
MMATTQKICIDQNDTGLWEVKQTAEAAVKASELLQQDLETHHVFFNEEGFHNHIVHHLLSLYGTGAPPEALQAAYNANTTYQRPTFPVNQQVVQELQSWEHAKAYLGKERHYPDFLAFFQREIDAKGWEAVMSEYLFAGTASADDMLVRLYAGFMHPLIQMMYGVEFKQPAIVAEALAQTCVHQPNYKEVLFQAEKNANEAYEPGKGTTMPRIASLLEETRNDEKLRTALRPGDPPAMVPLLLERAPNQMMRIISKVKVRPEELEERTVEMFDSALFVATAASFHPEKTNKCDFFLIHHINAAPIFLTFNAQSWIPVETKARLLEWKIRYDLIQYAGRAVPALPLDQLKAYQPKKGLNSSLPDILSRLHEFAPHDDGHAVKLSRAAVITQQISSKYSDRDWKIIKGDDMWMRIHHLIADSVESPGPTWVRTTGLDQAWTEVPDKSRL